MFTTVGRAVSNCRLKKEPAVFLFAVIEEHICQNRFLSD